MKKAIIGIGCGLVCLSTVATPIFTSPFDKGSVDIMGLLTGDWQAYIAAASVVLAIVVALAAYIATTDAS